MRNKSLNLSKIFPLKQVYCKLLHSSKEHAHWCIELHLCNAHESMWHVVMGNFEGLIKFCC